MGLSWSLVPAVASHDPESDQDQARQALAAGEVMPLRTVLEQVQRDYPGQIMKVEFERDDSRWIYEIKLLRPAGSLIKLKIDARDGSLLEVKGREERSGGKH
ncbi:PepSY domain-containing protein [Alcaligenaceae bacterium CGII-47]|nr:PepSY domain-containing protein [Alcaligenaceae bacterium CGII-47]